MSTPTISPDHRCLPRKKRPPTLRDQAIYIAHRMAGQTQAQLAAEHRLSQRRISQIIHRVESWLACGAGVSPAPEMHHSSSLDVAPTTLDRAAQLRLDRSLQRARQEAIYDRAIRAFDTDPRELKTTRHGDRDGKPFQEETIRQQPANVQLLKTALRASADLGRLAERDPPPASKPSPDHQQDPNQENMQDENMQALVEQWLTKQRLEAEQAGKVNCQADSYWLVKNILKTLVGEPANTLALSFLARDIGHELIAPQPPASTLDLEPESLDSSPSPPSNSSPPSHLSRSSNSSNVTPPHSPEPESLPQLPIPNPPSKIPNSFPSPDALLIQEHLVELRAAEAQNARSLAAYYASANI